MSCVDLGQTASPLWVFCLPVFEMKGLTQVAVCLNSVDLKVLREEKLEKYWVPWSQGFCLSNGKGSFILCVSAPDHKVTTPLNTCLLLKLVGKQLWLWAVFFSGKGMTQNQEMRKACLCLDPLCRLGTQRSKAALDTRGHFFLQLAEVEASCKAIWWAVCVQHCAIMVNRRFYHAGVTLSIPNCSFFFLA